MADMLLDGMVKVGWVSTIADATAPTVAELTAGLDLEDRLTPDGLDISYETETIDNSSLASTYTTNVPGRRSVSIMLKYKAATGGVDDVKDALTFRASGYLVVRRGVAATVDWAAAQTVEVYPGQCGSPNPDAVAPNAIQTVTVPIISTATPQAFGDEATVAA